MAPFATEKMGNYACAHARARTHTPFNIVYHKYKQGNLFKISHYFIFDLHSMNWKAAQMFKLLSGPWKFSRLGNSSSSYLRVWAAFLNHKTFESLLCGPFHFLGFKVPQALPRGLKVTLVKKGEMKPSRLWPGRGSEL